MLRLMHYQHTKNNEHSSNKLSYRKLFIYKDEVFTLWYSVNILYM